MELAKSSEHKKDSCSYNQIIAVADLHIIRSLQSSRKHDTTSTDFIWNWIPQTRRSNTNYVLRSVISIAPSTNSKICKKKLETLAGCPTNSYQLKPQTSTSNFLQLWYSATSKILDHTSPDMFYQNQCLTTPCKETKII